MHLTNKNTCAPTPPMGWNSYDYYDTTVDLFIPRNFFSQPFHNPLFQP